MLELSYYVPNEIILELLLPYMFFFVNDTIPRVRAQSISAITKCVQQVTVLPRNEVNIFPEYILPNLVRKFADYFIAPLFSGNIYMYRRRSCDSRDVIRIKFVQRLVRNRGLLKRGDSPGKGSFQIVPSK